MITYFHYHTTAKTLAISEMGALPNKGELVMIDAIWYVVVRRTFYIYKSPVCLIWVKEAQQ